MGPRRPREHCARTIGWILSALGATALALANPAAQDPGANPDAPQVAVLHVAALRARIERALPGKPEGLCSGDFDGDGTTDLAATLVAPGALLVWHGSANGLAHEFESIPCGDFPLIPVGLPRGSFGAGPGVQSIAVASRAARTIEVAGAPKKRLALERTPRALAAGSIEGQALIAVACDGRRLELLRDGASALELRALSGDLPRCAFVSTSLCAVIVGFQDLTAVEAYSPLSASPIGRIDLGGIPRAIDELDFDGDGDLELAVAGGDHELWIFGAGAQGGARAWFERREALTLNADAIPTALAVADFDSDGRADLAMLNDFSLSLQVMTRLSATGAQRLHGCYAGQTPVGLAALDFDGDGVLDLAVANRDTQGLGLLRGDGAGGLILGASLPVGDFPQALAAAPMESGGGALRMVALNVKSNSVSAVIFADGALRPLAEVECGSEPRAPLIAEFDGQPGLDVLFLVAGQRGADLRLFHGDLDGRLSPAATLELRGGASDLALLDVDGDGVFEIAACDPRAGRVLLLENGAARGDEAALSRAARLSVPTLPRDLTLIELDGDPPPELACVLASPGERVGIAWLDAGRNAAGELSLTEIGFTALSGAPSEAAAGDLNGDGRADLAVMATRAHDSSVGAWFALLRGPAGPVEFTVAAPISTGLLPRAIAAGDLDGDGRAEVFVAVQNSTLVQVWTPDSSIEGVAFAARAYDSLGAGRGPFDLCLADVDGDGLPDLCVANAFSNDICVLQGVKR